MTGDTLADSNVLVPLVIVGHALRPVVRRAVFRLWRRGERLAAEGAGFLAVHCPDEHAKERAWAGLKSTQPWVARYYAPDGLEHLVGEA